MGDVSKEQFSGEVRTAEIAVQCPPDTVVTGSEQVITEVPGVDKVLRHGDAAGETPATRSCNHRCKGCGLHTV